jgi:ABC-type Fe3+-hydroxamate transport system substrate-binding protein
MRRNLVLLAMIMALVGAACGGAGSSSDGTSSSSPSTSPATTGQQPPTTADGEPAQKPEGPLAPDFTLALGADGSETFVLSQEAKPVYMVFWAEW